MEEELREGGARAGGVAVVGVLDEGVENLDAEGVDVAGGPDWLGVHEDVRPAELLGLLQDCCRSCTSQIGRASCRERVSSPV